MDSASDLCREMLLADQCLHFLAICFNSPMDKFGLSDNRGVWKLPFKYYGTESPVSAEGDPFISIHQCLLYYTSTQ